MMKEFRTNMLHSDEDDEDNEDVDKDLKMDDRKSASPDRDTPVTVPLCCSITPVADPARGRGDHGPPLAAWQFFSPAY